jgi:hypothetical protein
MKIKLLVFICLLGFSGSYHAQFTYYLMGRPFSVERNNALLTVGKEWNIQIDYAGQDKIELNGLEYFNKHNDSVSKLIGTKTKLGDEWLNSFYAEVDQEELEQNKIRTLIKEESSYKTTSGLLFQTFLLMEKRKCKKKSIYAIYLAGQLKSDESRIFYTHIIYKYNTRKQRLVKTRPSQTKLPFVLPQNGIN